MTPEEAKLCVLSQMLEEVYQLLGKLDLPQSTASAHLRVREKSPTPSSVARKLRTRLGKCQLAVGQYQREMKSLNAAALKESLNRLYDWCDPGLL